MIDYCNSCSAGNARYHISQPSGRNYMPSSSGTSLRYSLETIQAPYAPDSAYNIFFNNSSPSGSYIVSQSPSTVAPVTEEGDKQDKPRIINPENVHIEQPGGNPIAQFIMEQFAPGFSSRRGMTPIEEIERALGRVISVEQAEYTEEIFIRRKVVKKVVRLQK